MESKTHYNERRQHPRLDMYLPVHFHIKDSLDDNSPESMKYFQGFTKNYSKGGLLIEALNLSEHQLTCIQNLEAHIEGSILIPTHPRPVRFQARPAWSKHEENNIELIGLYFIEISKEDADTLSDYAMMINKKAKITTLLGTILVNSLIAFIIMAVYIHFTSSKIISKQSRIIEGLQKNQTTSSSTIKSQSNIMNLLQKDLKEMREKVKSLITEDDGDQQ
jgi:large-conductance mechanosensitive channel